MAARNCISLDGVFQGDDVRSNPEKITQVAWCYKSLLDLLVLYNNVMNGMSMALLMMYHDVPGKVTHTTHELYNSLVDEE